MREAAPFEVTKLVSKRQAFCWRAIFKTGNGERGIGESGNGNGEQGTGNGNGERGTGNGESLKWGIFKSGNL